MGCHGGLGRPGIGGAGCAVFTCNAAEIDTKVAFADRGFEWDRNVEQMGAARQIGRVILGRQGCRTVHGRLLLPTVAVFRGRNGKRKLGDGHAFGDDDKNLQPVDLRGLFAAHEVKFDRGRRTGERKNCRLEMVGKDLAILLAQDFSIGDGDNPLRQARVDEAIGDQLCGEVVIIGAGVIRRAEQREIAVRGRRIQDKGGTEVLLGRAGIDADAAGRNCTGGWINRLRRFRGCCGYARV